MEYEVGWGQKGGRPGGREGEIGRRSEHTQLQGSPDLRGSIAGQLCYHGNSTGLLHHNDEQRLSICIGMCYRLAPRPFSLVGEK
jgi:hypothetical protein